MQYIPNEENKRRDEAFAEFIGGVAFVIYEEDRGWPKEVWDAAWSAKREWINLTEEEIDRIYCDCHDDDGRPLSIKKYERAIEAKLREKNSD
jgi:hypothetical protein